MPTILDTLITRLGFETDPSGLKKADKEIEMFSFRKVKERLISSILYLAEKYGEETDRGVRVSIGFTHQDLGELAGAEASAATPAIATALMAANTLERVRLRE